MRHYYFALKRSLLLQDYYLILTNVKQQHSKEFGLNNTTLKYRIIPIRKIVMQHHKNKKKTKIPVEIFVRSEYIR